MTDYTQDRWLMSTMMDWHGVPRKHTGPDVICRVRLHRQHDHSSDETIGDRVLDLVPTTPPIKIGRSSKNSAKDMAPACDNIWVDSPIMSRAHGELWANAYGSESAPPKVFLRDYGSMHGTFVNGHKLAKYSPFAIESGDELKFGTDIVRGTEDFRPCVFSVHIRHLPKTPGKQTSSSFSVPEMETDDESEEEYIGDVTGNRQEDTRVPDMLTDDSASDPVTDEAQPTAVTPGGPTNEAELRPSATSIEIQPSKQHVTLPEPKPSTLRSESTPDSEASCQELHPSPSERLMSVANVLSQPMERKVDAKPVTPSSVNRDIKTSSQPIDLSEDDSNPHSPSYVVLEDSSDEAPEEQSSLPAANASAPSQPANTSQKDGLDSRSPSIAKLLATLEENIRFRASERPASQDLEENEEAMCEAEAQGYDDEFDEIDDQEVDDEYIHTYFKHKRDEQYQDDIEQSDEDPERENSEVEYMDYRDSEFDEDELNEVLNAIAPNAGDDSAFPDDSGDAAAAFVEPTTYVNDSYAETGVVKDSVPIQHHAEPADHSMAVEEALLPGPTAILAQSEEARRSPSPSDAAMAKAPSFSKAYSIPDLCDGADYDRASSPKDQECRPPRDDQEKIPRFPRFYPGEHSSTMDSRPIDAVLESLASRPIPGKTGVETFKDSATGCYSPCGHNEMRKLTAAHNARLGLYSGSRSWIDPLAEPVCRPTYPSQYLLGTPLYERADPLPSERLADGYSGSSPHLQAVEEMMEDYTRAWKHERPESSVAGSKRKWDSPNAPGRDLSPTALSAKMIKDSLNGPTMGVFHKDESSMMPVEDDFPHAQPKGKAAALDSPPVPDLEAIAPGTTASSANATAASVADVPTTASSTSVRSPSARESSVVDATAAAEREANMPPRKRVKTVAKSAAQALAYAAFGAAGLFAALVATCPENA